MRGFKTHTALPTTDMKKLLKITHHSLSTLVDLAILDKMRCAGWCRDLYPMLSPGTHGQRPRELQEVMDVRLQGCRELSPTWALQHSQTGISPLKLLEMQSLELSLPKLWDFPVPADSSPLSPAARRYAGRARTRHDAARLSQATTRTTAMSLK